MNTLIMIKNENPDNQNALIRPAKLLSEKGICSRREAEAWIEKRWVFFDDQVCEHPGARVSPNSKITLAPPARKIQSDSVTILLHKPIGFVSSQPEDGYEPAIRLLKPENFDGEKLPPWDALRLEHLRVCGRLDIDSQGLLIFTQDGRVAKTLIGPESQVEKEYLVRLEREITETQIRQLRDTRELDGEVLKPMDIQRLTPVSIKMILREGKKRQIRRVCEQVGLRVTGLKRVRVGRIMLGHLPEGHWRIVGESESFV